MPFNAHVPTMRIRTGENLLEPTKSLTPTIKLIQFICSTRRQIQVHMGIKNSNGYSKRVN